jgi:hypothetical protein
VSETKSQSQYIVIYDDNCGLCVPYSWDDDCEGAIVTGGKDDTVAVFSSRKDATKAIQISTTNATLRRLQGLIWNSDFNPANRGYIRIVRLQPKGGAE